jgi:hypothetical protein
MAVSKSVLQLEAVFERVEKKFESLSKKADSDWDNYDYIIFPVHSFILSNCFWNGNSRFIGCSLKFYFVLLFSLMEDFKKNFVLLSKIAKEKKYAQEYLGLLARRGDLGSIRIGKRWYTKREWFSEFLAEAEERKAQAKSRGLAKSAEKREEKKELADKKTELPKSLEEFSVRIERSAEIPQKEKKGEEKIPSLERILPEPTYPPTDRPHETSVSFFEEAQSPKPKREIFHPTADHSPGNTPPRQSGMVFLRKGINHSSSKELEQKEKIENLILEKKKKTEVMTVSKGAEPAPVAIKPKPVFRKNFISEKKLDTIDLRNKKSEKAFFREKSFQQSAKEREILKRKVQVPKKENLPVFEDWLTQAKQPSPNFLTAETRLGFFPKFAFSLSMVLLLALLAQAGWVYKNELKGIFVGRAGIVAGAQDKGVNLDTIKSSSADYLEKQGDKIRENVSLSSVLIRAMLERSSSSGTTN